MTDKSGECQLLVWTTQFWIYIHCYTHQPIRNMRNVLLRVKVELNLKRIWPNMFLAMVAGYVKYQRIFIKCTKSNYWYILKHFDIKIRHLFTPWLYWVYLNKNHWIIRTKKDFLMVQSPYCKWGNWCTNCYSTKYSWKH